MLLPGQPEGMALTLRGRLPLLQAWAVVGDEGGTRVMDYNIRIVEHSAKAVVAQGDPAHDLCRALKRMGYANIVLPLRAFATGKVSREYVATGAALVVEDLIDAEEQMLALEKEESND